MPIELFRQDDHACLMFSDLAEDDGQAVQSNQFLIVNGKTGAIIDPGGNVAYNRLVLGMAEHFPPHNLSAIVASHADPDIIASLDRWMTATPAKLYISRVWERFAPHFCKPGKTQGRIVGLPDSGGVIDIGGCPLVAVPAHFLHAEGNFQFYDPISRILFSGDLGVSLGAPSADPVTSLAGHLRYMEGFHRRYMVSNKVMRLWARMARTLDISMIVPQHGVPLTGKAVGEFIDWAETVDCGIDLMTANSYQVPGGWTMPKHAARSSTTKPASATARPKVEGAFHIG